MKHFTLLLTVLILLAACSPARSIILDPGTIVTATATPVPVPTPTEPATAVPGRITGTVWHDLCQAGAHGQPGTEAPPVGCTPGEQGGYRANGHYDDGEPGIEGALVSLGYGDCATGDDYFEIRTDAAGAAFLVAQIPAIEGAAGHIQFG